LHGGLLLLSCEGLNAKTRNLSYCELAAETGTGKFDKQPADLIIEMFFSKKIIRQ
jgi:hypothetical protein